MKQTFSHLSVILCFGLVTVAPCTSLLNAQEVTQPSNLSNELADESEFDEAAGDESNEPESIYPDIAQFGGPSSVGGQLAEDTQPVQQYRCPRLQQHFEPWFQFKGRVNDHIGLQFAIDESILYQVATESPGEQDAASGLVRIYGQWEIFRGCTPEPGYLVYKAENRHRIGTGITPFDLGFEAGSILPTGTFFSEFEFTVTNLFWKQYFHDRRWALAIGRIDVTDFIDVYAMMNPLTHFINLAFSTNPTIAVPNQGLGVAAGGMLTDNLYVQGGLGDANGQPTRAGWDTFFGDAEYFKYFEVGLTTSQDRIYLDNMHVTLWHVDPREEAGVPEGFGVAFSAQKFICDEWLPFIRAGYADGDASLLQATVSAGLGKYYPQSRDVFGVAFNWGKPAIAGLRDQFTSEMFYRCQLTEFLAVTPDVQLILNPALNPDEDVIAFFGLRFRAAF